MSSVSSQLQTAVNEVINEQVLPQIQATLKSGQVPSRRWEAPGRSKSEEILNRKSRSSSRGELFRDLNRNEDLKDTHYSF